MKFEEIRKVVKDRKNGTFMSLTYEKDVPVKVSHKGDTVFRRTTMVVRCGVEYDNISSVKDKRQEGILPTSNAGLPWGAWKEYPYFIEHNGKTYLRCATVNCCKSKSEYFLNGKQTDKEAIKDIVKKESSKNMDIITINIDNIVKVA